MNLHSKKDFQDCMLSILEPLNPITVKKRRD